MKKASIKKDDEPDSRRLSINTLPYIKKEYVFLAILFSVSSFLLLTNLGDRCLWQDEAETALVSRTILRHGIPKGYDGKNFFSQVGKDAYGRDYVWILDPPLPFYITAISFRILGVNTFAARFPFVLFGIATIILTYFFARSLTEDRKTAFLSALLLMFSVSFLLLARQCRYYSLSAFFSLLCLHAYLATVRKEKGGPLLFTVTAVFLFHTNYSSFATLLATLLLYTLIFYRKVFPKISLLCLIACVLGMPWFIWTSEMRTLKIFSSHVFDRSFFLNPYLHYINSYIFPAFLLLIPAGEAVWIWVKKKDIKAILPEDMSLWKNLFLLLLFIVITVFWLALASPYPFFRYLTKLIPVFCIITAIMLKSAIKTDFNKWIAAIGLCLAALFLFDYRYNKIYPEKTGIKYLNFFDYIEEITTNYTGSIKGMVDYLNENGRDDDIVAATYGDLPLKFYTNMRVIGWLTGADVMLAKEARWVIVNPFVAGDYIFLQIPLHAYEKIELPYPDLDFSNMATPELHHFRTRETENPLIIFKKPENLRIENLGPPETWPVPFDATRKRRYMNAGTAYYRAGLIDKALEVYTAALEKYPEDIVLYSDLIAIYGKKKQYVHAIEIFARGVSLNPRHAELYRNIGIVYWEMHNYGESVLNWEKYLALRPEATDASLIRKKIKKIKEFKKNIAKTSF